ncbi:MAG: WYL domain-containing protein [Candidatus Eremiobacteraeota bacterium]|nr:WYL domain-containing protein [Candidatus Eremiobacteraeota bacterium]MBV8355581.1 WYL domain-containing protein [Candidatus Eremiobacteraeota bacterium]
MSLLSGGSMDDERSENDERGEPKVVLLVRLLNAIDEGRHTFEELKVRIADSKPPSTRTLRRYLSILSDAGFPWYFDRRRGTYRFTEGYSLKRLNLSSRELFGLVTLKRLGASLGGTLSGAIEEATSKLVALADARSASHLESSSLALRVDQVVLEPEGERAFEVLREAESQRRRARFQYVDKNGRRSERNVDPYGFIVSSGRVYLVGYDHTRSDMRVFAIDNVTEPRALPTRFEKPVDFDLNAFGVYSLSGVRHSAEPIEVTIRFSPIVAKAARRARVAPQRRIEERADGSIDVVYAVAEPLEVVRWTLSWGGEAEVIAPGSAREAARELVEQIAQRYAAESGEKDEKDVVRSAG